MGKYLDSPVELQTAVAEFWPYEQWDNAAAVAELESGWDPFALNNSVTTERPCGTALYTRDGVMVTTERSVGWFQINSCNFPAWPWERLFNTRHNVGTAHMLWAMRGWQPWYFSAKTLGLL
jgi:hypothetical protein